MNVNGLPSSLQTLLAAREQQAMHRPDAAGTTGTAATQAQRAATPAVAAKPAAAHVQGALGPQAPEGTDPALWSVLTGDERAFFSRVVTSGPLTYSKMAAASAGRSSAMPAIRGGRIDIRA
jgi:hypothetical protein